MDQEKIGKFIAQTRKEKNMTQQDLANKLGVSNKTIGNWENGRNMPDLSLFKPLCNELEISADELILGEKIGEDSKKKDQVKKIVNDIVENNSKEKGNIKKILEDIFFETIIANEVKEDNCNKKDKYFIIILITSIVLLIILYFFMNHIGLNNWLQLYPPIIIGLLLGVFIYYTYMKNKQ